MRAAIYRAVNRAYFTLKGFGAPRVGRVLEKSQWQAPEELIRLQNENLAKMIRYVYAHVPYYRRVMEEKKLGPGDIETVADLEKFPVLTKEIFRREFKNLMSSDPGLRRPDIRKTGGSTGEPLRIAVDYENSAWEAAAFQRGLGFSGYKMGDTMVSLFGGTLGLAPEKIVSKAKARFAGSIFLPAFEISSENARQYAKKIKDSGALFLHGYSSAIYLLAKLLDASDIRLNLRAVFPTAETLFGFQRERIEKVFGGRVFDQYGCGEINSIAFECASHRGLHITDENVIVESLDRGWRVAAGVMGSATLTTLHNFAMPLIRYQNGDAVTLGGGPCPCGRGLSLIEKIYGRTNDLLVSKSGTLISASFVPHLFRDTEGIVQIQLIQESRDSVTIKIVKGDGFTQGQLDARLKVIRDYLGDVEIKVEYVVGISRTPKGKLKFAISKLENELSNK